MSDYVGKRHSRKDLLAKVRPGDIILRGSQKDMPSHKPKTIANQIFYSMLKPLSGYYAPHAMVAVTPETVIHQEQKMKATPLASEMSDRFMVLRPVGTKKQIKKAVQNARKRYKEGGDYNMAQAIVQGLGGTLLPKKARDIMPAGKKDICTGMVAKAFHDAGVPLVKGKPGAALTRDIVKSKAVEHIGWAGRPITKAEKRDMAITPYIVGGSVLGASGAVLARKRLMSVLKYLKKLV